MAETGARVKKYVVKLSAEEREHLEATIGGGKRLAQLLTRARILRKADESEAGDGWTDSQIAEALDTSVNTVGKARQWFVEEGFDATLAEQKQSELRPAAKFRRRGGGQVDRPGRLAGSRGLRAVEPVVARREGRRTEHRGESERQHDRTDSKETLFNPTAIGTG